MAEKSSEHNEYCGSPNHKQHLCYFVSQGFHLSNEKEYNQMVSKPKFKCQHCGRVAHSSENLCEPTEL